MDKTRDRIRQDIREWAESIGAECNFGTEDGYAWVGVWGGPVSFLSAQFHAAGLSAAAGRDFYLSSSRGHSFEGALDADFRNPDPSGIPPKFSDDPGSDIGDYGERFTPDSKAAMDAGGLVRAHAEFLRSVGADPSALARGAEGPKPAKP